MKSKIRKNLSGVVITAILLLLAASQTSAHNLWIGLDHYDQKKGDTAKIFLHRGPSLPFSDFARPEKMKDFFYLEPTGEKKNLKLKKYDPESFFNEVGVD
ncbi:MAG: hypothetical protein JJW03_03490, partial [Desulfosarcina sp.]|nr:hypothetical protein [Desulfobacterales bacterium]